MYNLYSMTKGQAAIREVARAMVDRTGILTTAEQLEAWMTVPASEVAGMQLPLPDGALTVVARGGEAGRGRI